jgi:hypothetical protein
VTRYRLRRGGSAVGEVIAAKVRSRITGPPGYTYWTARRAVVRYADLQGRVHSMEASRDLPAGHPVPVAYNPARPDRTAEPTMTRELRGTAVCLAVTLGLVLAMLLTLWAAPRAPGRLVDGYPIVLPAGACQCDPYFNEQIPVARKSSTTLTQVIID